MLFSYYLLGWTQYSGTKAVCDLCTIVGISTVLRRSDENFLRTSLDDLRIHELSSNSENMLSSEINLNGFG